MITLSYLQLCIIIFLSAGAGAFIMALFSGNGDGGNDDRDECYYCPFPCERNK